MRKYKIHSISTRFPRLLPRLDSFSLGDEFKSWINFENRSQLMVIAPEGWITDLRSGPSVCDLVVPKIGNENTYTAYIIHDILYECGHDGVFFESRASIDELFYEILCWNTEHGVGLKKVQNRFILWAVKLFGRSRYNLPPSNGLRGGYAVS